MKLKLSLVTVVILLSFSACKNSNTSNTKKVKEQAKQETHKTSETAFSSEKYGFSITFPSKPAEKIKKIPSQIGDVEVAKYNQTTNGIQYIVIASELPKMIMALMDADALLAQAKSDVLKKITDLKIISEKKITIDQYSGIEIEVEGTYQGVKSYTASRLYIIDNKPIQVLTVCEVSKKDRTRMYAFLDSFKLK